MTATQLMTDLARLGICIEAHGDRLRYSPRSAVTPDLTERMKANKTELLAILRNNAEDPEMYVTYASATRRAARDRVNGGPLLPPDVTEALPAADSRWEDGPEAGHTDESIEVIEPPDPCPDCGTLELWQTLAGNWRCLRCDPPHTARRWAELAARLKSGCSDSPRMDGDTDG